ncbi:protein lethal(2)essential for life [Copidosoma floridanum]|uniref:protein lethal(2)essential for life n=1 Tax=Copidosoma floridanum TaxID=29053 RepID=UPI0006C99817|nr:protein lethal(2)essential for life [Copidosoma floridanum]
MSINYLIFGRFPVNSGNSYPSTEVQPRLLQLTLDNKNFDASISNKKDALHLHLDCKQFLPDEITIKVVDRYVMIEGQRKEPQVELDHSSLNLFKQFLISEEYDIENVHAKISLDHILTIEVPEKNMSEVKEDNVITMEQTNEPIIEIPEMEE